MVIFHSIYSYVSLPEGTSSSLLAAKNSDSDARSVGPRIPQVAVSAGEARGTTGP